MATRQPLDFCYWVPNVSGGLVVSKIPQRTDWGASYNVKLAQIAEAAGFSHALTQIRFLSADGSYGATSAHESVSFSQHILGATTKLRVIAAIIPGPSVPIIVAKQLATISNLSNERIDINVVSGWFKTEFTASGQLWLDHGERYRRSEEFIDCIRGLWTTEKFNYRGSFYQFTDFTLSPRPTTLPRVFQGGNSADARGMAARVSDILLLNGQRTIKDLQELVNDTLARAKVTGRDVKFGINSFVIVRDTEEEALKVWKDIVGQADLKAVEGFQREVKNAGQSVGGGMWSDSKIEDLVQYNDGFKSKLIGTAEQVADRILLFRSLGIATILTAFLHFQEETEAFGKLVIPLVRAGELAGRGVDPEFEIIKSNAAAVYF